MKIDNFFAVGDTSSKVTTTTLKLQLYFEIKYILDAKAGLQFE